MAWRDLYGVCEGPNFTTMPGKKGLASEYRSGSNVKWLSETSERSEEGL